MSQELHLVRPQKTVSYFMSQNIILMGFRILRNIESSVELVKYPDNSLSIF